MLSASPLSEAALLDSVEAAEEEEEVVEELPPQDARADAAIAAASMVTKTRFFIIVIVLSILHKLFCKIYVKVSLTVHIISVIM